MKFRPADVAKECGVTVNTIRNWCRDYAGFLSSGAKTDSGNRELSEKDVEVFKYIAQLRKENMQKPQILLRLSEKSFGDIVPAESANIPANQPTNLQESPQQAIAALAVVEALQSALSPVLAAQQAQDARLEALESQRLRFDVVFIAVITFIAGLVVGLSVWWFQ